MNAEIIVANRPDPEMTEPKAIQLLSQAKVMLAEARDLIELKEIRDRAEALRIYSRSRDHSLVAQNLAAEVRLRAERQIGELLSEKPGHGGDRRSESRSHDETLKNLKINKTQSSRSQAIASVPEKVFEQHIEELKDDGQEITTSAILRLAKDLKNQKRKSTQVETVAETEEEKHQPATNRYTLIHAAIADVTDKQIADSSVDWIITDPPRSKEAIRVFSDLAVFATRVLKDGGSLICLADQHYLPQILGALSPELEYRWISACMKAGAMPVHDRNVNSLWTPLLRFTKGKPCVNVWTPDVFDTQHDDKSQSDRGPSEVGMADILRRFTKVGHVICDPFLGGGTIGVVAVKMNRMFIGVDRHKARIDAALELMAELEPDA